MADSIYNWSMTASANDAADSIINWRENQLPDTVNDSNRGMMQRIAEWREDMTGGLVTAGTQPAYTLTSKAAFSTLANGRFITVRAHASNVGPATLNVNGLGAKAVRKYGTSGDMALANGDLQLGGLYQLMYSASADGGAGGWIMSNPSSAVSAAFPAGTQMLFLSAAAPVGWTKLATHDNKALRIVSGAGGGAGGTHAFTTLFAAASNAVGAGTVGGTSLTEANLPAHTHAVSIAATTGTVSADHTHTFSDASSATGTASANHTHTTTLYAASVIVTTDGVADTGYRAAAGNTAYGSSSSGAAHTHTVAVSGSTGGISANHTHSVTVSGTTGAGAGSASAHVHPFTGSPLNLAVAYVDALICQKD